MYGLKPFVADRTAFLDTQLDCSAVQVPQVESATLMLYPNPVSNLLFFEFGVRNSGKSIQIFSATGQLTWEQLSITGPVQLDVSAWPVGVYIAVIQGNSSLCSQRFVKE